MCFDLFAKLHVTAMSGRMKQQRQEVTKRSGVEKRGAETMQPSASATCTSEDERAAMVHFVVHDLCPELYVELLQGLAPSCRPANDPSSRPPQGAERRKSKE